jgi:hypothetical protein
METVSMIGTRSYLLDVQKPWLSSATAIVKTKQIHDLETRKKEIIKIVQKKVYSQFLLDFPRTRVTCRNIYIVSKTQLFDMFSRKLIKPLKQLAIMLVTQGCFAYSWEQANLFCQSNPLISKKQEFEGTWMLTDTDQNDENENMIVDFDFVESKPDQLQVTLKKTFRYRNIDKIDCESISIFTEIKMNITYPISETDTLTCRIWT